MIAAALALMASTGQLPPDLAAAVRDYDRAQVAGDRAALERLVDDTYVLVNSRGQVEDKAKLIADYTEPGFRLDPFTVEQAVAQVWSDGAVMGGVASITGLSKGQPFAARLRFSDIWARKAGRWRVVYAHVSVAP